MSFRPALAAGGAQLPSFSERWEQYAQRIFPGILARQDKDGSWNGNIGRPYSTAMHVLCLTAPYEQSPMHQR